MQPLKDLLDILPVDYAASFIVEIGRQNDSQQLTELMIIYSENKPEHLLLEWFSWQKSRQGSDYWHKVFKYLEERQESI